MVSSLLEIKLKVKHISHGRDIRIQYILPLGGSDSTHKLNRQVTQTILYHSNPHQIIQFQTIQYQDNGQGSHLENE